MVGGARLVDAAHHAQLGDRLNYHALADHPDHDVPDNTNHTDGDGKTDTHSTKDSQ